jgi:hypothetical protein
MDTSLNIRIISISLLTLIVINMPIAYGINECDDGLSKHECVQVFVNSKEGVALANMVVYLEPLEGQILNQSSQEVIIGQQGKSFNPYISVSQVNSKVNFVNQDDITHHIYSAGSDNKFSFKIRAGKTNALSQFDHEAEVAMGCNIHDWMSGYLLVVNTPYFAKTDEQGMASFNVAQQGRYKVVLWHPQMKTEKNRLIKEEVISANTTIFFSLKSEVSEIPLQESDDDFDFLSDYE